MSGPPTSEVQYCLRHLDEDEYLTQELEFLWEGSL